MSSIYLIWWLFVAHFISDWGLQNRWMAENKHSYWEILLAHCMIYTSVISIALEYCHTLELWKIVFIFIGHYVTDFFSSNICSKIEGIDKKRKVTRIDHVIHFLQLLIVAV